MTLTKQHTAFQAFSAQHADSIETALKQALPTKSADSRQLLNDALAYSLLSGGKRIRPLLCIATHQLFNANTAQIMPLAVAIEMIHCYSLIHDDLPCMDDDDFRRGKPSSHKQFGEDIAVLAGDSLNTLAFEVLSTQLGHYSADSILQVIRLIASQTGIDGLIGGQILDIHGNSDSNSVDALQAIHSKKTGALFHCCILCPALLEQAPERTITLLTTFSKHLGLLFQIVDDILDVTANQETLGKTPNKDEALNKLTYVSLFGLDQAKAMAEKEALNALDCLSRLNLEKSDTLKEIVLFILNRSH